MSDILKDRRQKLILHFCFVHINAWHVGGRLHAILGLLFSALILGIEDLMSEWEKNDEKKTEKSYKNIVGLFYS
jgi:hypothetical protein